MLWRALLVCPGQVPAELGGDDAAACQTLGLPPIPRGYALYLLHGVAGRVTRISRDGDQLRTAERRRESGAPPGSQHLDLVGVVRDGWPVELGGGPRCQFCRDPDPAWVCDSPDVAVLVGVEPVLSVTTRSMGRTPWPDRLGCLRAVPSADRRRRLPRAAAPLREGASADAGAGGLADALARPRCRLAAGADRTAVADSRLDRHAHCPGADPLPGRASDRFAAAVVVFADRP